MASALASRIILANGRTIPRIHLGVYMTDGPECENAVKHALEAGYRAIDSAAWYYNEADVGRAINSFIQKTPGVGREDIIFTTKLKSNISYEATKQALSDSLKKCELRYIDLYLLHSPYGGKAKRLECWNAVMDNAVMDAVDQGLVKSAGVSNFGVKHLKELLNSSPRIKPVVNQVEVHPFNTQAAIVNFCAENSITVEAYAPLARAMRFKHSTIKDLSEKYKCNPAQLMVKWSLQKGYVVLPVEIWRYMEIDRTPVRSLDCLPASRYHIRKLFPTLPKSVRKERIVMNAAADEFTIKDEGMRLMDGLHEHLVTDWDPTDCN